MELVYIFTTAFVVGLSGAMMPGPLLTVTITESARRGFMAGPLLVLGHAILEGALVIALAVGLAAVLTKSLVSMIIAVVGGFFLIWMGWSMARDAYFDKVKLVDIGQDKKAVNADGKHDKLSEGSKNDSAASMHPVLAGVLVSLSNPYWSLWWATVGLGYITMSLKYGTTGMASFFSGHILSDLAWYCLVAAGVAGGRRFLSAGVYRGIILICGLFLVLLGGSFVYYGMTI